MDCQRGPAINTQIVLTYLGYEIYVDSMETEP